MTARLSLCALGALLALSLVSSAAMAQDKGALRYLYQPGQEILYQVKVNQETSLGLGEEAPSKVEARFDTTLRFLVGEVTSGDDMALDVRFRDFSVELKGGGESLQGQEFTSQLGEMRLSLVQSPRGEVKQAVVAGGNPQIKRTTSLLRDLVLRSLPVLPEEALSKGHTWEDRTDNKATKAGSIQSTITRRYTVQDMTAETNTFAVTLEGEVTSHPEGGKAMTHKLKGQGTIVWDQKQGRVQMVNMTLSQDGQGAYQHKSTTKLAISPK